MEAGIRIFSLCMRGSIWQIKKHWCSQLTASRTLVINQPSLRSFPLTQHRFMSQESTNVEERPVSTFERSKPREKFNNRSFPSDKSALNSQEWRQFLTSDEKTIVCVHPAKPVSLQDTKV